MKAALLPDRGVVKVAGADPRGFLNGLLTTDVTKVTPTQARFGALLTPQGKIVVDCIVAEAPAEDGGGFFLDCPRALAPALVEKLNFYKLRAKVICEDLSEVLGVMAVWGGSGTTEYGLVYADPRLAALGQRIMLPPHLAKEAAADLGAELFEAAAYEAHRIALGVPRGGLDFIYGDAFPHEADMDQLAGVDFDKGCYVGQEVVSRMEHRGTARTRIVPATAALPCCGSIASPTRERPARPSPPAAPPSNHRSPPGRRSPGRGRRPDERNCASRRRAASLSLAEAGRPGLRELSRRRMGRTRVR
jgi:folate-binding protein YgfZ